MGMVVRTNAMAVNANRQLASNNTQVAKSLEKLSSGFRINRAGDDASGLAISEKMKAQIKGLDQASSNSQDGISLVQTAEGNLSEVHDMLGRMVELAEKSANGILENTDRDAIQAEMNSLANEIDRIADSANFNNIKLFDGSLGGAATVKGSAGTATAGVFTPDATKTANIGMSGFSFTGAKAGDVTLTWQDAVVGTASSQTVTIAGFTDSKFTGGKSTELNTKTIGIKYGGTDVTKTTATIDNTGNLTITFANTEDLSTATKLEVAINAALLAADKPAGGTATQAQVDAWKAVTFANGTAGAFVAPTKPADTTATDILAASAMAGGVTAKDEGLLATDDDGKTAFAKMPIGGFKNGAITFAGDFIGAATIADATKTTTALVTANGAIGATTAGTAAGGKVTISLGKNPTSGSTLKVGDKTYEFVKVAADVKGTNIAVVLGATDALSLTALQAAMAGDAPTGLTVGAIANGAFDVTKTDGTDTAAPAVTQGGAGLKLQIGDTNDDFNKLQVSMSDMHMAALFNTAALTDANYNGSLGTGTATMGGTVPANSLNVKLQDDAAAALKSIRKVIDSVSTQRGDLGALQNRLEHTINNLDVTSENMTSANSRIRDTDMAKEMMNYTKMNVLVQSAQAMLAQANQQPQSILQLLQ